MDAIPERRTVLAHGIEEFTSFRNAEKECQSFGALADHRTDALTVLEGSALRQVSLTDPESVQAIIERT